MGKFIDLTGQKFGRLTAVEHVGKHKGGGYQWLCQCKCGKQTIVASGRLKSNRTKSCGCLCKENTKQIGKLNIKHGYTSGKISRVYKTWDSMCQRCNNPNSPDYKYYGGRGIKVCQKWWKFEGFLKDMGERPPNTSIDRINNNGDYYKENCRWTTNKTQHRNTRVNKWITINNVTICLSEWCEILNLNYNKVWKRIKILQWTPEEALELVPRKKRNKNA